MKAEEKRVVRHPATELRFREAARKLLALKKTHQDAINLMWAGALLVHFSDDELVLLNHPYLSEFDRMVLKQAGRPIKTSKSDQVTHKEKS